MAAAGATAREGTPPPVVGKVGRYTVFIATSATPKTPTQGTPPPQRPGGDLTPSSIAISSPSPDPKSAATAQPPISPPPPPVQVPPQQFGKPTSPSSNSLFGFLWDAVVKVQDAHSSLDEYLAHWFGLNQSKYQWALDDYYENKNKAVDKISGETKDLEGKGQSM